jgi:pimeloyl-ACP methyl ester carboxylesterase
LTPFYFGTGERRLFGILTPKQKAGASDRGVVLCHPWGVEYQSAHRAMRQLAAQLARAGLDVLRFDYYGTGDSSGEMLAMNVAGSCDDIGSAIEELRDTTGAASVGLIGLRLGATLAAAVAAQRGADIDSLVLWDPVVSGREYAAEILLGRELETQTAASGLLHIAGFPLSAQLREELLALDLLELAPALPPRTLVAVTEPSPSHSALQMVLPIERIEAEGPWYQERDLGVGAIPTNIVRRIVEWHA